MSHEHLGTPPNRFGLNERRYSEQIIEPGEEAYVLGTADTTRDAETAQIHPEDAVVTTPDDGLRILSDQNKESIESEFNSGARFKLGGGTGLALLGGVLLAYMLLPL